MKRLLVVGLLLGGCTDAEQASLAGYGKKFRVSCYSGGVVFYEGVSSGRVATVAQSDGWEFEEAGTGLFVRVSGPCVIKEATAAEVAK